MAPFTCCVLNTLDVGIPGVFVVLELLDESFNCLDRSESSTDETGGICYWCPLTQGLAEEPEYRLIDMANIPKASITFFPPLDFICPWSSIRADIDLTGNSCHAIVLHLEDRPRLEHRTYPVAGPLGTTAVRPTEGQSMVEAEPISPFILPPPRFDPRESSATLSPIHECVDIDCGEHSRKRKSDSSGEDGDKVSRRRIA